MAGQIIISNIKTDSDNAFSILANTGAVLFSANLASGITTGIADGSVTNAKLAGSITGDKITVGTLAGNVFTANTITGDKIGQSAISSNNIVSVNASVASVGTLPKARLPAGSVLQVVSATLTTLVTASADTWTTVTSASITPSSASNKILIFYNMPVGAVGQETISRVLRGATVITEYSSGDVTQIGWSFTGNGSAGWQGAVMSGSFLDSPSTTSSTTYNLQAYQQATTLYVNRTSGTTSTDSAGGVTTITLMEVAG